MNIHQKTTLVSAVIIVASLGISGVLYFVFHVFFLFIIFVPAVIYWLLQRRNGASGDNL